MLTASVETSQAQVHGSLRSNFRPAYDVLVRPADARSAAEQQQGLIPDNFGSGLFGGISFAQYHRIEGLAGVDVAAPVANIGYVLPTLFIPISIAKFVNSSPVQLFRIRSEYIAQRGLSTYPGETEYVYYTKLDGFNSTNQGLIENTPDGPRSVCNGVGISIPQQRSPFDHPYTPLSCFSGRTPGITGNTDQLFEHGPPGATVDQEMPLLLSAVDPVQEARLLDLNHSMVSGRYLRTTDAMHNVSGGPGQPDVRVVPVIADSHTYLDETLRVQVERLTVPTASKVPDLLASRDARQYLASLHGSVVAQQNRSAATDYPSAIASYEHSPPTVTAGTFSEYRDCRPG